MNFNIDSPHIAILNRRHFFVGPCFNLSFSIGHLHLQLKTWLRAISCNQLCLFKCFHLRGRLVHRSFRDAVGESQKGLTATAVFHGWRPTVGGKWIPVWEKPRKSQMSWVLTHKWISCWFVDCWEIWVGLLWDSSIKTNSNNLTTKVWQIFVFGGEVSWFFVFFSEAVVGHEHRSAKCNSGRQWYQIRVFLGVCLLVFQAGRPLPGWRKHHTRMTFPKFPPFQGTSAFVEDLLFSLIWEITTGDAVMNQLWWPFGVI